MGRRTRGHRTRRPLLIPDPRSPIPGSRSWATHRIDPDPNGNFPAPQDINNLEADFGLSAYHQPYNSTTSLIWTTPFQNVVLRDWQIAAINSVYSGEPVTFIYTPLPAFQVSGIAQDFRGANNYRPNVVGGPYAPEFLEMPGLQLTVAQASRLWHFDSALCTAVLATLVEQRFLVETRNRSFARA